MNLNLLEQFRLDGQVAIVTGAGRGVGAGIARVLAEAGATIVGTARTESEIVRSIASIEETGGEGLALVADAMSRSDGERVVNTAMEITPPERITVVVGYQAAEVQAALDEELARRQSPDALVPIDRDPVPKKYSELVRRYYEKLGSNE